MTRKEFQERVDFSLTLNEWAAEQPGYQSPVTTADVAVVMAKLRKVVPLKKSKQQSVTSSKSTTKPKKITPSQLGYSAKAKIIVKKKLPPIDIKMTKVPKPHSTSHTRSGHGKTGDHVKK
jgi:hypothetical protein